MEGSQHQDPNSLSNDDVMLDPEVIDLLNELSRVRGIENRPLTVEEQAQILGTIINQKQAQNQASQYNTMTTGFDQFDEEAMGEAMEEAMEEAVRATKRRRLTSKVDLTGAYKMFAYGPEEQPSNSNHNGGNDELDCVAMDTEIIGLSSDFEGEYGAPSPDLRSVPDMSPKDDVPAYKPGFNLLESVCSNVWLAIEVAKHLPVKDIVQLYSTSRTFHELLNGHWQSSIFAWAEHMAPSSLRIFYWKFFGHLARPDPAGTTWAAPGAFANAISWPPWAPARLVRAGDNNLREVPGLGYLAMLVERETRVRDILALMARSGHRLPKKSHLVLKKMWLLMDLPGNALRRAAINNTRFWSGEDLFNAQMFVVKLQLRFNEPNIGPNTPKLAETLLGSPLGLTPLWQMLRGKKYTDLLEAMQMRVRYLASNEDRARAQVWDVHYGVPQWQLGRGHLEGWGQGSVHMSRPDELVIEEAVRRGINLKGHLTFMMFWGHIDWQKRKNLVPSEEELYMSDDELPPLSPSQKGLGGKFGNCGNVPSDSGNWSHQHVLQSKWDTLTDKEKLALNEDLEGDETRMLPFEEDQDDGFWDLDPFEAIRLNYGKKVKYIGVRSDDDSEANDENEPNDDIDEEELEVVEEHDPSCVCEDCLIRLCRLQDASQPDDHEGDCLCEECMEEIDIEAEDADDTEGSEEDYPDSDDSDSEADEAEADAIPIPEELLSNDSVREAWGLLSQGERAVLTRSVARQRRQQMIAAGPDLQGPRPASRQFPNVTDPICLALLRKLDGIPSHVPANPAQPAGDDDNTDPNTATEDVDMDVEEQEYGGDAVEAAGDGDNADSNAAATEDVDMDGEGQEDGDADNDASTDDEQRQLKALAEEDYSDDDLEFDMGNFQAFLAKGQDDGGYDDGQGGSGVAHESDLNSPTTVIKMRIPDVINR
ncbi:hypothetical protein Daus18300_006787 [Diaporthe australafricana]|uniref:Uncharacterized protein n=1 Tax=Diaporthe australafricana TaxID=127596 RepID=A0ABR3WSC1_9PEZI